MDYCTHTADILMLRHDQYSAGSSIGRSHYHSSISPLLQLKIAVAVVRARGIKNKNISFLLPTTSR